MMYLKLSVRNARRSFSDYLLYVAALTILLAVMVFSECISSYWNASGFQSASLPIIISVIQLILVGYIDQYILKQRAKELASYLLLGMEKNRLANLFLAEFFLIGSFCFLTGAVLGSAVFALLKSALFFSLAEKLPFTLLIQSVFHSLFYFCLVEILCAFYIKHRMTKLEIRELMHEKIRNHTRPKQAFDQKKQGFVFLSCMTCFLILLWGIACLPSEYITVPISVIAVPLLASIFSFYQWLLGFLAAFRQRNPGMLSQSQRLYLTARLTSNPRSDALVNAVFCLCLLFAYMSFTFGILLLQPQVRLFRPDTQALMGTAQICLCVIFLVIYFFLLSLRQIMEQKRNAKDIPVLYFLGMDRHKIRTLAARWAHADLSLPMLMAVPVILLCIGFLNTRLNFILPDTTQNIIVTASVLFSLCIALFYTCFFKIVTTAKLTFSALVL